MNIRFHNTLRSELPVSIRQYKTVRVVKAIIPTTYYNISGKLHNNYFQYAITQENKIISQGSIVIQEGLYTPQSYNIAVQKSLKEKDLENAIEILYLEDRGLIKIKLNNEEFAPLFHNTFCKFLGLDCGENYIRQTITGTESPKFLLHHEYRIYCNIVDSSKNLINGAESKLITSFVPKGKHYGDINEYTSLQTVDIQQYDYSNIEIGIKNHENEDIVFKSAYSINLLLE